MKTPNWISTADQMPPKGKQVLLWYSGYYSIGYYMPNDEADPWPWRINDGVWHSADDITLWCPIPERPEDT